jgi:uncharacterized membrane protein (DUF485 family)
LLLIAGPLYMMFQLYRRGGALRVPAGAGIMATLEFHRLELERQRDALHSVWKWYLLPFAPGFLAVAVVGAIDEGINFKLVRFVAGAVILFVVLWILNEHAARKLDLKVQEVKAMEAGGQ